MVDVSKKEYAAFLSYSRKDETLSRLLHRRLECFRVPKSHRRHVSNAVSTKFRPIFRDVDEFSASNDLGASIRSALRRSSALIVLCTEASSKSEWVRKEISEYSEAFVDRPIIFVMRSQDRERHTSLLDAISGEGPFHRVLIGGNKPTANEICEIVAHAFELEPLSFRKKVIRAKLFRAFAIIGIATTSLVTVTALSAAAYFMIITSGYVSAFSVGQDAYVRSPACDEIQRLIDDKVLNIESKRNEWVLQVSETRRILVDLSTSCRE